MGFRSHTIRALAVTAVALFSASTSHAQAVAPEPAATNAAPPASSAAPGEAPPRKTSWVAHILRRTPMNLRLQTLNFPETQIPVLLIARPGNLRPLVEIRGLYNRPGWTLYAQSSPVAQAAAQGTFKFYAFLNARINEVVLTTRGPNGELEEERIYIFAPEAQEFQLISPWNALTLSAGSSYIDYFQTGFGNYLAYTGSLSARYSTFDGPRQLGLFASLDFTALTLASQPIDRGPQFIEAKVDGTITLPYEPQSNLKVQLLLGGNFVTMLSNGSPFGFSNLISPEFGVRARYIINPTEAIIADARFTPLGGESFFSEAGFLLNATWSKTLLNSHRLEMGFNYSAYSYHPETTTEIRFGIFSFLVGYSI